MVRADGVDRAVGQSYDQCFLVRLCLDGRIAFQPASHPFVVFVAEPEVIDGSLGSYAGIRLFGRTDHLHFLGCGDVKYVQAGSVIDGEGNRFSG